MTDEMIRELGAYSVELLASEHFKTLNALFEQQVAVDVLNTKTSDTEGRERLYATLQGSRAFTAHIEFFAAAFAKLTEVVEPVQDIDSPDVHDIYG